MMFWYRCSALRLNMLVLGVLLSGCTQTTAFLHTEHEERPDPEVRVLLMQPDVELYELTAGGLLEPRAQWTRIAKQHIATAVTDELRRRDDNLIPYQPPVDDPAKEYAHQQIIILHKVVGQTILRHKLRSQKALATKKGKFDWSLGKGVAVLHSDYDAEYALFIYIRDSYASAGRIALIVSAALLGAIFPDGRQVGFASLVDLRTGDIIWFSRLVSESGDLRSIKPARETVRNLLVDLPL